MSERVDWTYCNENTICIVCLFSLFCGFVATDTLDVVESIRVIRLVVSDVKFPHGGERGDWRSAILQQPGSATGSGVPTRHTFRATQRLNALARAEERMDLQADSEPSLLDKIDAIAPAPLKSFDAFPKLPSTYRKRSSERGFLTLFIALIAFLLVANDIGEFLWGWPDYEFGVDYTPTSYLDVNVDLIVNMPCRCANPVLPVSKH
jgi:hypothetical protein